MRILMLAENDPAGAAIRLCRAVNAHTPHRCRLATTQTRYNHAWEPDLHVPDLDARGLAELQDWLTRADVFHFHLVSDELTPFGPFVPRDFLAGKTLVHHHHGHPDFRGDPQKYQEKYRRLGRKNLLVSTPDLLPKLPGAVWQPNLVFVHEDLYLPPEPEPSAPPVVVAHSPTRKDLKNTKELLRVIQRLGARHTVRLDCIDDAPHVECLARKRASHIVFDHMQGYFGMSSLEALSQGRPTIAGLDAWNLGRIAERFGVDLAAVPWVLAHDEAELEARLAELVVDADLRAAVGVRSRRFMEAVWSPARVAAFLSGFYDNLS